MLPRNKKKKRRKGVGGFVEYRQHSKAQHILTEVDNGTNVYTGSVRCHKNECISVQISAALYTHFRNDIIN